MRLIDADAFAEKIKEISDKQGYNTFYTDKQSVGEILHSVVDDLTGNTIYGYENCPTVLTIPDNPTNGDMQQTILPKHWEYGTNGEYVHVWGDGQTMTYTLDWWNAPYKRGSDNGNDN